MSMRDLAAAVHVSRAHVYTRVKRLLDDGVIRRFTIQVDPERVGFSTSAYLTMKVEQNSWRQIRDGLAALPWVEHVALVSGDFDVLLLVRSASNRTLRDLVFTHIQSMPGVRSTLDAAGVRRDRPPAGAARRRRRVDRVIRVDGSAATSPREAASVRPCRA